MFDFSALRLRSRHCAKAIARYCRSAAVIDVLLTDINLGGPISGWDVADYFRLEEPEIPVLYMSGGNMESRRCLPGSVFVAKPLQHSDLLSVCERLRSE